MIRVGLKSLSFLISFLFLLSSCDFSSELHQDILFAQKSARDKNYSESIALYEEILKKNPPLAIREKIYFRLGELYSLYAGNPRKGIKYFEELRKETEDPGWLVKVEERIGDIRFTQLKDYVGAIENYEKLVGFSPKLEKNDFYEFRLASSFLESRKFERAIDTFSKINQNQHHEYNSDSVYYIGLCYFQKNDFERTLKIWGDFVTKGKSKERIVEVKFLMGTIYETQEKYDLAYEFYYSILGDYPNPEVVKDRIKSLHLRRLQRKR
ncbi:MAG: tetratricopeptide repeat protein [Oligoflexia bacterium]|nr:tetratricopeptide repeat protein [Oligoflexia bacterium]MBF0367219.1 tetratricopeptide repeat protein [Oligoflexia bacterium]